MSNNEKPSPPPSENKPAPQPQNGNDQKSAQPRDVR